MPNILNILNVYIFALQTRRIANREKIAQGGTRNRVIGAPHQHSIN